MINDPQTHRNLSQLTGTMYKPGVLAHDGKVYYIPI